MFFKPQISLLLASLLLTVGCAKKENSSVTVSNGTLVMGTNAEFPPFESRGGADGQSIVGFDVKIAEAVAKKLGRTLKIEDMKFDALIPALNAGKVDFVAAGMTINEERQKNVDFSSPYYLATQTVIYRKGETAPQTADDLKGKKLAASLGFTGNDVAIKITGAQNVTAFSSGYEAVMELKNKKVDAVIIDAQPALNFAAKNQDLALAQIPFDAESYGIAVKKGNSELVATINGVLAELKASGTYDSLVTEFMK